jgi:hypothetical protein
MSRLTNLLKPYGRSSEPQRQGHPFCQIEELFGVIIIVNLRVFGIRSLPGTPRASRYAFRRLSLHLEIAASKASCAIKEASSVDLAYWLPAEDVAAPYAEAPEALALEAALDSEDMAVSPVSCARCLRAIARSSFLLEPCGTRHWVSFYFLKS